MSTSRRAMAYFRPYFISLIFLAVLALITAQADVLLALFVKPLFDEVFINRNLDFLYIIPIFALSLIVFKGATRYAYAMFLIRVNLRVTEQLREQMFNHFLRLSLNYFNSTPVGQIMNKVTIEVNSFQEALSIIFAILSQTILFIALMAVIFYRDWKLALLSLMVIPIAALPIAWIGSAVKRYALKSFEALSLLSANIQETIAGIRIVKAFRLESIRFNKFNIRNNKLYGIGKKVMKIALLLSPSMEFIISIGLSIILYYGGLQVIRGELSPGSLFSFFTAVGLIYEPVRRTGKLNNQMQISLASAARVFSALDEVVEVDEAPDAYPIPEIQKEIAFNNVSMKYGTEDVLKDLSFTIKKGEAVALVGPSGAGKSTIANLIPRFYDVNSGSVTIDGVDIRKASMKSLRSQIGVVTQDTFLFNATLRENIAYGGSGDVSDAEIEASAKDANAHDFIIAAKNGYDTMVGERGMMISGGERQRIAIARAMLKNAPILILDEATSSLDSESEQLVQKALYRLMENRTTLVIAHRLSTVRRADRILVIDDGTIVEQGKHEELMKAGGLYQKLYEMQYFDQLDQLEAGHNV